MLRKTLSTFLFVLLTAVLMASPAAWGADAVAGVSLSAVLGLQQEISSDLGQFRKDIHTVLEGFDYSDEAVAKRRQELDQLSTTLSDDMASWGYTEAQREQYEQLFTELRIAYSSYADLVKTQADQSQATQQASDVVNDAIPGFASMTSADTSLTDALRQEIQKQARYLNLQFFNQHARLSRLRLELNDAMSLKKAEDDAKAGGTPLELPRTHALELEHERVYSLLLWAQTEAQMPNFNKTVSLIQGMLHRLGELGADVAFPKELLDAKIKQLDKQVDDLNGDMTNAQKSLDAARSNLAQLQAQLGDASDPLTVDGAHIAARRALVRYREAMVTLINDEIDFCREAQDIWKKRYKVFHNEADGNELWQYRDDAQKREADLQDHLVGVRTWSSSVLNNVVAIRKQAETASADVQPFLTQERERFQRIIPDVINRYESLIPAQIFLVHRLYSEASDGITSIRVAEKVTSFSRETFMNFMNTELWQGEGYAVTVSKLIIAVVVFLSSFFLSSLGSRWIKRWMIRRFKASATAANATQRIVFYILWFTIVLIALNIVKIPLTAFAFLGGAFMVGLGFGMQTIFSNIISGLIVIFSRPFKVNDIISMSGVEGKVQDIGSRSTTIKTWDSLDVILPNRYFLENSVTNWTGSDMKKRDVLKVGVGYDSDSRQVEDLLLKVANEHSGVLKDPSPFVWFRDFGDSSLNFELYFWVDLRQSSTNKVASDMRHHILSMFREANIEIPFPQQDVHIIPPDAPAEPEAPEEPEKPKEPEQGTENKQ